MYKKIIYFVSTRNNIKLNNIFHNIFHNIFIGVNSMFTVCVS